MHPDFNALVDRDEVSFAVTRDLNDLFGNQAQNLSKVTGLVEQLTQARHELQQRVRKREREWV